MGVRKSGVLLFTSSYKLLIVKNKKGQWGVPQGHKEKDENHHDCALRELYEETGVKLDKVLPFPGKMLAPYQFYMYYFKPDDGPVHIELCDIELAEFMFVDQSILETMLKEHPFTPKFADIAQQILQLSCWSHLFSTMQQLQQQRVVTKTVRITVKREETKKFGATLEKRAGETIS